MMIPALVIGLSQLALASKSSEYLYIPAVFMENHEYIKSLIYSWLNQKAGRTTNNRPVRMEQLNYLPLELNNTARLACAEAREPERSADQQLELNIHNSVVQKCSQALLKSLGLKEAREEELKMNRFHVKLVSFYKKCDELIDQQSKNMANLTFAVRLAAHQFSGNETFDEKVSVARMFRNSSNNKLIKGVTLSPAKSRTIMKKHMDFYGGLTDIDSALIEKKDAKQLYAQPICIKVAPNPFSFPVGPEATTNQDQKEIDLCGIIPRLGRGQRQIPEDMGNMEAKLVLLNVEVDGIRDLANAKVEVNPKPKEITTGEHNIKGPITK